MAPDFEKLVELAVFEGYDLSDNLNKAATWLKENLSTINFLSLVVREDETDNEPWYCVQVFYFHKSKDAKF